MQPPFLSKATSPIRFTRRLNVQQDMLPRLLKKRRLLRTSLSPEVDDPPRLIPLKNIASSDARPQDRTVRQPMRIRKQQHFNRGRVRQVEWPSFHYPQEANIRVLLERPALVHVNHIACGKVAVDGG